MTTATCSIVVVDHRGMSHQVGSGPLFVVVSGRPGSGKSTVAAQLAAALGLSLLAKDAIKQALIDVLGARDIHASRDLGRAARHVLTTIAATSTGAVLDSVWPAGDDAANPSADPPADPSANPSGDRPIDAFPALPALLALPGTVVEVHCDVSPHLAAQRYRDREARRGAAVPGWDERGEDEQARAGRPVAGGWPVLRVDTSGEVDLDLLVRQIRAAADPRAEPA